jgi:hypothetical protein
MVKQSLEKQPRQKRGTIYTLDLAEVYPRCNLSKLAARVMGIQRLNWLHLREQKNRIKGTKRNAKRGREKGQ